MAKETKAGETPAEKKPAEENILAACDIRSVELTERETFRQFMLAVAGRDDANYKNADKIAADAAELTAVYLKRSGAFKG